MATIGTIKIRIGADIESMQRSLKKAERSLQRSGRKLTEIGNRLSAAITLPVLAIGAASLKTAGDFEALEKGMESMMGSAEAAKAEIALLRKEALKPGLNYEQALKGSVRLQAVQVDAELARRALAGFGNALALVGGTGEQLDGVTLALSQIAAKGKISAEEINQLAERVPQIRQILKDGFGTADTEELQKLGIGFEEFVTKAIIELEKLPQAQSGIKNSIENTQLALQEAGAIIGKKLFPIFEKIANVVVRLATIFGNLPDSLQNNILQFGLLAAAIGPVLSIMGSLKLAAAAVLGGFGSALGIIQAGFLALLSPIGLVVASLTAIGVVIVTNFGEGKKRIVSFVNGFVSLYKNSLLVRTAIEAIVLNLKAMFNVAKAVVNTLLTGFSTVGKLFKAVVLGNFDQIPSILKNSFKEIKSTGKELFKETGKDLADSFKNAINGRDAISFISENDIDKTVGKLQGLLSTIKEKLLGAGVGNEVVSSAFSDLSNLTFNRNAKGGKGKGSSDSESVDRHQFDRIFGQDAADINTQTSLLPEGLQEHVNKVQELSDKYKQLGETLSPLQQTFLDLGSAIGENLAQGVSSFRDFARATLSAISDVIGGLIKQGVTAAAANALKSVPFPFNIAAAGAAGGLASGLFRGLIGKITPPKLAKGGLAFGETLATVGDNFNAAVDPEVIAPLSTLNDILANTMQSMMPKSFAIDTSKMSQLRNNIQSGGNITIDGVFKLLGPDLVLALNRANQQGYRVNNL